MTADARARLDTMVRTTNGFEIAETDLQLRGPGEFFGTRQSGEMGFQVANPLRDREFLENARKEAFALAEDAERNHELRQTLRALPAQWQRRYHLAQIGGRVRAVLAARDGIEARKENSNAHHCRNISLAPVEVTQRTHSPPYQRHAPRNPFQYSRPSC